MKEVSIRRASHIACVCVATAGLLSFAASQAYGFYQVHGNASSQSGKGVVEITAIIDDSANDGAVKSELLIMPEGSTVADVLDEFVYSDESKANADAQTDYRYESIADRVDSGNYRCIVSTQAERVPGVEGNYGQGEEVSDYASQVLERYDNVAFIAQ